MNSAQHRIIAAGVIGNVLEWYDFAIYGYFAAAIGRQFFPHEDPVAQLLSAFGVFALGYLMRPIGGALFGHIGDQFGFVPFAPGGGADIVSRLLSPHLQNLLGQSVIVENRAGAAARIGTGIVAKSDPDGYTLLVTTESSLVLAPHIGQPLGYDPLKDFAPISLLTRNTVMLVVNPSVPARTLQEYIALTRSKPGHMFYASSGVGGPNHLAGEIFNRMTGLKITHVPYQGTGLALQAVISNQVGAMWGFMAGLTAHICDGTLRAIAVGSKERSPVLPEVPTVAEAGVPGFEAMSWIGVVAPAGTPGQAIDKLWDAINAAMREPTVRNILISGGSEVVMSKPEEFRQVIESDYAKYGKLADLFQSAK